MTTERTDTGTHESTTVVLTGGDLSLDELVGVARGRARVTLRRMPSSAWGEHEPSRTRSR